MFASTLTCREPTLSGAASSTNNVTGSPSTDSNSTPLADTPHELSPITPGSVEQTINSVEWGVANINADDVWTAYGRGEGVVVATIDTGVQFDHPALVNQGPYGEGWMIRIKPDHADDIKKLLSHEDYANLVEQEHA